MCWSLSSRTSESKFCPLILLNFLIIFPFHSYFDCEDAATIINFSKAFKQLDHGEVLVMDHVGKFLNLFIGCVQIADKKKVMEKDNVQLVNLKKILDKLVDKITDMKMQQLGIFSTIDMKASVTVTQYLTCLQALIIHCSYDLTTENIANITRLFAKHQAVISEATKVQENAKKAMKRGKNTTEVTVAPGKKIEINFDCLWELKTCGTFVKIFFEPNMNEKLNDIKTNSKFCRFVLKSTAANILRLSTAPDYLKFKHSKSTFSALCDYAAIIYNQMKLESFKQLHEDFDDECAVAISESFKNAILTMEKIYNTKWEEFFQKLTGTTNPIDFMTHEIIKSAQSIIDWAFDPESEVHVNENGERIVVNLFIAMETLFRNFQSMPNQHARETYMWLLRFCKSHEILQKNLNIVNRILFQFMLQQDAGCTMAEPIAHKISVSYGLLDDLEAPEEATQHDLLSITAVTIDSAFFAFANVLKKQIEDIEFCISRMNSYNSILKMPGQPSHNESAEAMKVLEMSSVIKMASMGKIIGRLSNSRFPIHGLHIETIGRVVTNYFLCLANLIRHFNQHFDIKKLDLKFIPLEMLLKEVKTTMKRAYALSPYIEDLNKIEQQKAAKGNNKKKVVVMKEQKYSPRLIGAAEKVITIVLRFDKLTKRNFARYICNTGEVRDFRIITREAMEVDNSDEEMEQASENENDTRMSDSDESVPTTSAPVQEPTRTRRKRIVSSSDETNSGLGSDSEDNAQISPQVLRPDGFEKNLRKIVKKSKVPVTKVKVPVTKVKAPVKARKGK